MAANGLSNDEISKRVGLSFVSVSQWRNRYAKHGIVGLKDETGRGRKRRLSHDQMLKIAEVACMTPKNATHWSVRRLADELGFIKKSRLQKVLKGFDLKPHQSQMWCFSNDPKYEEKKADVVGLYLNPPKNALVICIDEKPQIQALSRQAAPMRIGVPERRSSEYERHGTIDLFGAFCTNDGKVIGAIEPQHRGVEFLKFMKTVYAKWGRRKKILHVIIDNLGTHDVQPVQDWLAGHRNVHFHFTPTHASWLNQIELWISILERQIINRGSHKNTNNLSEKILAYINEYNTHAKPFAWCYGQPLKI
ncbi:IS630 family transposase [Candidatus Micrarchaeota archaeon]|nr:IS630 family transposase [Candidatus Micrarchaeota archaeon]